jgi:accessory gene regulator protein AgrB
MLLALHKQLIESINDLAKVLVGVEIGTCNMVSLSSFFVVRMVQSAIKTTIATLIAFTNIWMIAGWFEQEKFFQQV